MADYEDRSHKRSHSTNGSQSRPGGQRSGDKKKPSRNKLENRTRKDNIGFAPKRKGYREERMESKTHEPYLDPSIDMHDLDPSVLQDLKSLAKDNAEAVARHMITSATLMEDDPALALEHARAAKNRAGRVAVARETNGIAAYHAGEWKEALSELRAARRISGGPGLIAVMADCERGLGRPEKAIELWRSSENEDLDDEERVELGIVAAGARFDQGQFDAAVTTLESLRPSLDSADLTGLRLAYAYADALVSANREPEAMSWFTHVAQEDKDGLFDAAERLRELSGDTK